MSTHHPDWMRCARILLETDQQREAYLWLKMHVGPLYGPTYRALPASLRMIYTRLADRFDPAPPQDRPFVRSQAWEVVG